MLFFRIYDYHSLEEKVRKHIRHSWKNLRLHESRLFKVNRVKNINNEWYWKTWIIREIKM